MQTDIAVQEELKRSAAIAAADKQAALSREIEQKTKAFNRKLEDFQVEMEQEQTDAGESPDPGRLCARNEVLRAIRLWSDSAKTPMNCEPASERVDAFLDGAAQSRKPGLDPVPNLCRKRG